MANTLRANALPTAAEIIRDLETARELPATALGHAVEHAEEIAPAVIAVVEQAAAGVFLLPKQEELLFWGVHALAAARRTELCGPLLRLLKQIDSDELEVLLGDATTQTLPKIVISTFDGDPAPLIEVCARCDLDGFTRWSLILALARLTFDGRVPRATTVEFLDRFEREALEEDDGGAWEGWIIAIWLLGVEELVARAVAVLEEGRGVLMEGDREDWRDQFAALGAADLSDPKRFEDENALPFGDPVEELRWLAPAPAADRPGGDAGGSDSDPASAIALDGYEKHWLERFLESSKVPRNTLSFEQVDGLFSALIAGPVGALPRRYLPHVWDFFREGDVEPAVAPSYDNEEQAEYVHTLLTRHWMTIRQRLEQGHRHLVEITRIYRGEDGREWASGFTLGVSLRETEWKLRFDNETIAKSLKAISDLVMNTEAAEARGMTGELRQRSVRALPKLLASLHHAWRGLKNPFPEIEFFSPSAPPGRKVGRNERCPCGSGKKYKRCCGTSEKLADHWDQ